MSFLEIETKPPPFKATPVSVLDAAESVEVVPTNRLPDESMRMRYGPMAVSCPAEFQVFPVRNFILPAPAE